MGEMKGVVEGMHQKVDYLRECAVELLGKNATKDYAKFLRPSISNNTGTESFYMGTELRHHVEINEPLMIQRFEMVDAGEFKIDSIQDYAKERKKLQNCLPFFYLVKHVRAH